MRWRLGRIRSRRADSPPSEAEIYRAEVRERLRRELTGEWDRQRQASRHPYKGTWKTRDEITRLQRSAMFMHIELVFLGMVAFVFSLFSIWRVFKITRRLLFP